MAYNPHIQQAATGVPHILGAPLRLAFSEDAISTEVPTEDPSEDPAEDPVEDPAEDPADEVRAVYDGDISSSILQKFVASYNRDYPYADKDYLIVRLSQYDYRMYVGNYLGNGRFDGDTVMYRYYGSSSSYNIYYYWDVSTLNSPQVDVTGYSGYIYSSDVSFPAAWGIDYNSHLTSVAIISLLFVVAAISLFRWIVHIMEVVHE